MGDTKRSEDIERRYAPSPTDNPSSRVARQYRRRLEYRCQGLLTKAAERCRLTFQKAYDKCYDKVTFLAAWLLCWPMKLTFICSMVSVRLNLRQIWSVLSMFLRISKKSHNFS